MGFTSAWCYCWCMAGKASERFVWAVDTLEKPEWGPAEIFGGDLSAEIAELKARDDEGTVLVHGGPDFAQSLTRLGLVDEYQLTTVPIAIGAGHSPFAELGEHLKLDVVEEERFQSGALAQILVPKR
jgi:dihydrofolate reductase